MERVRVAAVYNPAKKIENDSNYSRRHQEEDKERHCRPNFLDRENLNISYASPWHPYKKAESESHGL